MVTREDLTPAQQAVQGIHAALAWAGRYGAAEGTVVFLAVPHERDLLTLTSILEEDGAAVAWFCEPDLGGALTAIAAQSSNGGKAHSGHGRLSRLPLALRGGEQDAEKAHPH